MASQSVRPSAMQPVPAQAAPAARTAQPVPIGSRGAIYTMTAAAGANAADLVNAGMIKKVIGKANPRRVMVAPPDGPSTSGGKFARQTITLASASGQGAAIMCGWLDVAQKAASLRDYRAVSEHHKARTGKDLDISAEEYLGVLHDLEGLLKALQVNLTHETSDPVQKAAQVAQSIAQPEDEPEPSNPMVTVIVGVGVALAAIVALVMLLR